MALLATAGRALEPPLHMGFISQEQLQVDYLRIDRRVHSSIDMHRVWVLECAHHVADGVALARCPEEFVAEPFSTARTLGEAGDVHPLDGCRCASLRGRMYSESGQILTGYCNRCNIGLNRAKREVRCLRNGLLCDRIEEAGFADIGQAKDADTNLCSGSVKEHAEGQQDPAHVPAGTQAVESESRPACRRRCEGDRYPDEITHNLLCVVCFVGSGRKCQMHL